MSRSRHGPAYAAIAAVIATLAAPVAGCDTGDPAHPSTTARLPGVETERRVRRLSDEEWRAAISDAVGADVDTRALPRDPRVDGFANESETLVVSPSKLEGYAEISEQIAAAAAARARCAAEPDACARTFARDLAARAYGRPIDREEEEDLLGVYRVGSALGHARGLELVVRAVITSPFALYRAEIGAPSRPGEAVLDDDEIASQLSFLLTGTRPDGPLLAAARAHALALPEVRLAEARRLLETPRAREALRRFFWGWLGYDNLSRASRSASRFPGFSRDVSLAMLEEQRRFFDDGVFGAVGTLDGLMTSSTVFPSEVLAPIYGADLRAAPGRFEPRPADPAHRRGFLSSLAFLTTHAQHDATSPVQRGLFVRTRLACDAFSSPPEAAAARPIDHSDTKRTTRQKFADHVNDPACRGCHVRIDPIGFGFESLDAIGRFRRFEFDLPVDDTGELDPGLGATGTFHGPAELSERLASSEVFRRCFVRQFMRFAEGRAVSADDAEALYRRFEADGRRILSLVLAYIERPAFVTRRILP